MKVVLYDDRHFSTYGAQQVMVSLAVHLHRRGWQPTVITGAEGKLATLARQHDVPVHVVPIPDSLDLYSGDALRATLCHKVHLARVAFAYSNDIWRAIEQLDCDVVVANALRPLLYCAVTRARSRRPIMWFLQGGGNGGVISAAAATIPHRIMTVSKGARKVVPAAVRPLVRNRWFVNPPGVDGERFGLEQTDRDAVRSRFGLTQDGTLVLGVGSVEHRKGFDVLLEAVKIARLDVPLIHLVIAGSARGHEAESYERRLKATVREECLPVTFLGWVDNIADLMSACDVFVLSSRLERFGLVTIEAMASSLPVVVTRAEGSEETVLPGETGLLVEPDDARGLGAALVELGQNCELRRRLGAKGRNWAAQEYTVERFVDRFVEEAIRLASKSGAWRGDGTPPKPGLN